MTNREYYTYNHVEFEGEFNKEFAGEPVIKYIDGRTEITELIDPKIAATEIDNLSGNFRTDFYRDGGSFDVRTDSVVWQFRVSRRRTHTRDGFLKYMPFVTKITYKENK